MLSRTIEPYSHEKTGLNRPSEPIYESARDFWAISMCGGTILLLPIPLAGADAELAFHPVELADFLVGWVGRDISRDDLGRGWGFAGQAAKERGKRGKP